jgi:hypothetical protein
MSTELTETNTHELAGPGKINELHAAIVKEWSAMNAFIEGARKKAQLRRIKLGYLLLELQQRIEAGENGDQCTFWEWFADMIPHSRSDAEKLMTIARQDDAESAYQKRLEKQKEYNARHYRKKFGPPSPEPTSSSEPTSEPAGLFAPAPRPKPRYPSAEGDDDLIEQLVSVFSRLSWDGCARGIKRLLQFYNDHRAGGS